MNTFKAHCFRNCFKLFQFCPVQDKTNLIEQSVILANTTFVFTLKNSKVFNESPLIIVIMFSVCKCASSADVLDKSIGL